MPTETVNEWLMRGLQAGVVGLFLFLAKLVFDQLVLKRLGDLSTAQKEFAEQVLSRMDSMTSQVQDHNQRLALGNQAFADLRDKVNDIARDLRGERDAGLRRDKELALLHQQLHGLHEDDDGRKRKGNE